MPHPTSAQALADWQACKSAHTAAKDMWDAQGKWAPRTVQPWLDDLAEKARDFKVKYGFDFNPAQSPSYGFVQEAQDFDASVAARTSHMQEA